MVFGVEIECDSVDMLVNISRKKEEKYIAERIIEVGTSSV